MQKNILLLINYKFYYHRRVRKESSTFLFKYFIRKFTYEYECNESERLIKTI